MIKQICEAAIEIDIKKASILLDNLIEELRYEGIFLIHHTLESAAPYVYYAESVFKILQENSKEYKIKRDISVLAERIGNYYELIGKLDKALEFYDLENNLFKELYDANPNNADVKNNLAISYEKLGNIYQTLGKLVKALECFNLDMQLTKELYEANPDNAEVKMSLAISYENLGEIYKTLGKLDKALECFNLYNQLTKELYEANHNNANVKNRLATSYIILGDFYNFNFNFLKARYYYRLALQLYYDLIAKYPLEEYEINLYKLKIATRGFIIFFKILLMPINVVFYLAIRIISTIRYAKVKRYLKKK